MPVVEYPIPLDSETEELFVHIETSETLPRRLEHFSIQYRSFIGGRWYPIVRYDASHGAPHRHILDKDGENVERRLYPNQTHEQVLARARDDLVNGWQRFREDFIKREGLDP